MIIVLDSCNNQQFKDRSGNPIAISIKTNPESCLILIDGEEYGISQLETRITPGEHTIIARYDGYWDKKQTFTAKIGTEYGASLELIPKSQPNEEQNRKKNIQISEKPEKTYENLESILIEAYNNHDWQTVTIMGNRILSKGDSLGTMLTLYAEGLAATGKIEESIKILDNHLSTNPDDYLCIQTKGNIYMSVQDYEHALDAFEQVISLNPNYARPLIYSADVYVLKEDIEKAISYYLKAIDLFYAHDAYSECLKYTGVVLDLQPDNQWGLVFRAATLYEIGNMEEYNSLLNRIKETGNERMNEILTEMIRMKNTIN